MVVFYEMPLRTKRIHPIAIGVQVCPLEWDGTPWRFEVAKIQNIPGCEIDYEFDLNVIVCECND